MKYCRNRKGDTIVEVMIAIVVLGAGLAGAFGIANSSVQLTQSNHEQYQAQLYANQQIELLRQDYTNHIASGSSRSSYTPTIPCYGGCTLDGLYNVDIQEVAASDAGKVSTFSVNPKSYRVQVTWPSLGGGPDRKVEIVYGI